MRVPWSDPWVIQGGILFIVMGGLGALLMQSIVFSTPHQLAVGQSGVTGRRGCPNLLPGGAAVLRAAPYADAVDPGTIEYRAWVYSIRTTWDNIAGARRKRSDDANSVVLTLRKPVIQLHWWMRAYLKSQDLILALAFWHSLGAGTTGQRVELPDKNGEAKALHVSSFIGNGRESVIGAFVARYTPHTLVEPPRHVSASGSDTCHPSC